MAGVFSSAPILISSCHQVSITWYNDRDREWEMQHMCCAGILCWRVDISAGISSTCAQVSLSDLYKHPHLTAGHTHTRTCTHTYELSNFRHKHFFWASKINSTDAANMTHGRSSPAKCNFISTFLIKLPTLHMRESFSSETANTSSCCYWRPLFTLASTWFFQKVPSAVRSSGFAFSVRRWASVWGFLQEKERERFKTHIKQTSLLFITALSSHHAHHLLSPPPFLTLPTVALKWLGKQSGGSWPVCIQCLHCCSIITPANQSTLQQLLCSSEPPPHSLLTLCLSVYPPLHSSY